MEDGQRHRVTAGEVLRLLRRQGWVPLAAAVVFATVAFVWSTRQPNEYEATTTMSVHTADLSQVLDGGPGANEDQTQIEIEVMKSPAFLARVRDRLGYPASHTPTVQEGTDLIRINALANTGARAAEAADTFAREYVEFRRDAARTSSVNASRELNDAITDLKAEIAELQGPTRLMQNQIDQLPVLPDGADDPQRRLLESGLAAEVERVGTRLTNLEARLNVNEELLGRVQLSESITANGGVEVLTPASVPGSPTAPKPARNAIAAGLIGLLVGAAAVVLLHRLDDRVRDPGSLEAATGLPALATVPHAPQPPGDPSWVVSLAEPSSTAAEAFRSLRTAVQFVNLERRPFVVEITSASPREGKSTVSANLGVAFAAAGHRTLVIGLDLRRPNVHLLLDADPRHGFSSLIIGESERQQAIQPVPAQPQLDVLPAGPITPNPSEVLQFSRTEQTIKSLRESYDLIIIDTPPVLPVSDASIVSAFVDATILVAMAGRSRRRSIAQALDRLRRVDAPLVGTLLSGTQRDFTYDAYVYGYGQDPSPRPPYRGSGGEGDAGPTPRANDGAEPGRRVGAAGSAADRPLA